LLQFNIYNIRNIIVSYILLFFELIINQIYIGIYVEHKGYLKNFIIIFQCSQRLYIYFYIQLVYIYIYIYIYIYNNYNR